MRGQAGKRRKFSGILILLLMAIGISTAARAQPVTGDQRLMMLQNFLEDGALIRSTWLEIRGEHADWGDGGTDAAALGVMIFDVADKVELGGTFGYRDQERSEDQVLFGERLSSDISDNGPADLNLFGKLQFKKGPNPWAAGLQIKAPVADEKEMLGSGSWDYELFVANRRTRTRSAWIWSAAVRFNGDPEIPGAGSGQTSAALAGGMIFKLSYSWSFLAETRYESRRYEGGHSVCSVMPTFDFRPTENLALRLGVDFGLSDGAPNENYIFGFVFHL